MGGESLVVDEILQRAHILLQVNEMLCVNFDKDTEILRICRNALQCPCFCILECRDSLSISFITYIFRICSMVMQYDTGTVQPVQRGVMENNNTKSTVKTKQDIGRSLMHNIRFIPRHHEKLWITWCMCVWKITSRYRLATTWYAENPIWYPSLGRCNCVIIIISFFGASFIDIIRLRLGLSKELHATLLVTMQLLTITLTSPALLLDSGGNYRSDV